MSMPVTVCGILKPDGELELDQQLNMAPGAVIVTVQPATGGAPSSLTDMIDRIHSAQQARGHVGRSVQEIEAQKNEGEAEYERRMRKHWANNGLEI